MSLLRSAYLAPLARRAALVLVCLTSAGASAIASPSAVAHTHAALTAHTPKKKAAAKKSSKKKTTHRTSANTIAKTKKTSHPTDRRVVAAEPAAPVLPASFFQQASIDLPPAGAPTMREAFALVPAAPLMTASTADAGPLSGFSASAEHLLSAMMDRARSQLGTRYVFGGSTPGEGLDCSAFARFAMEALGIKLPRTAAQQARLGAAVPRDRAMLKPGDLLTFGRGKRVSHVGIYLGEGHFIHASVSSGRIIETTIERNARLFRRWQGARRLMAGETDSTAHGAT